MQIGFILWDVDESYPRAMTELEWLAAGFDVLPFVGESILTYQGRFGDCHEIMRDMQRICDRRVQIWYQKSPET